MAISMLVSLVGTQMQNAAIDWHVWVLTRSPLALGFVGLVRIVPIVVLSLVGGLVADRRDRRRVLLVTQSTMTLVALALGAVTLLGRDSVGLVYLLTALTSAAGAFDNPSRQSLIPRLVPEERPARRALDHAVDLSARVDRRPGAHGPRPRRSRGGRAGAAVARACRRPRAHLLPQRRVVPRRPR